MRRVRLQSVVTYDYEVIPEMTVGIRRFVRMIGVLEYTAHLEYIQLVPTPSVHATTNH